MGGIILWATEQQPFLMGIVVSVIIGTALTLPISSAAICAALNLTGLAGGAAVAGCRAQMGGFSVLSFRKNRWGGVVSQGLGTSMLQMGNIVKNPRVWIPATLASTITGPVATCLFRFQMNGPTSGLTSGMGTCGLVGPIGVYSGSVNNVATGSKSAITGIGHRLAGYGPHLFHSPRPSHLAHRPFLPQAELDQPGRPQTGLTIYAFKASLDRGTVPVVQAPFLPYPLHSPHSCGGNLLYTTPFSGSTPRRANSSSTVTKQNPWAISLSTTSRAVSTLEG